MKISGVDIRPGNIIEYEGGIWRAVKIQHTQPGKGGAYMQVEMKNLIDGRKNNVRFRSAETVERVRLDTKDFQFLFADGDMLTFMDKETYEQISLPADLLGDAGLLCCDFAAAPRKRFKLGLIPHFADTDDPLVKRFGALGSDSARVGPNSALYSMINTRGWHTVTASSSQ